MTIYTKIIYDRTQYLYNKDKKRNDFCVLCGYDCILDDVLQTNDSEKGFPGVGKKYYQISGWYIIKKEKIWGYIFCCNECFNKTKIKKLFNDNENIYIQWINGHQFKVVIIEQINNAFTTNIILKM